MKTAMGLLVAFFIGFSAQAQQDKQAKDLLDKVTAKVKSYDNITINFKYSLNLIQPEYFTKHTSKRNK